MSAFFPSKFAGLITVKFYQIAVEVIPSQSFLIASKYESTVEASITSAG